MPPHFKLGTYMLEAGIDERKMVVRLAEEVMPRFFNTYSEAGEGPFALFSSNNFLELALPNGSLAQMLQIHGSEDVVVSSRE